MLEASARFRARRSGAPEADFESDTFVGSRWTWIYVHQVQTSCVRLGLGGFWGADARAPTDLDNFLWCCPGDVRHLDIQPAGWTKPGSSWDENPMNTGKKTTYQQVQDLSIHSTTPAGRGFRETTDLEGNSMAETCQTQGTAGHLQQLPGHAVGRAHHASLLRGQCGCLSQGEISVWSAARAARCPFDVEAF